jgi:hypothetical protein
LTMGASFVWQTQHPPHLPDVTFVRMVTSISTKHCPFELHDQEGVSCLALSQRRIQTHHDEEMADGDSDGGGDDAPEEELAERPKKKLKTAK